jgi:hypothetical protein
MKWAANLTKDFFRIPFTKFRYILRKNCQKLPHLEIAFMKVLKKKIATHLEATTGPQYELSLTIENNGNKGRSVMTQFPSFTH